jgi:hypothetical protein
MHRASRRVLTPWNDYRTAPEGLEERRFSEKTDVWAAGTVGLTLCSLMQLTMTAV